MLGTVSVCVGSRVEQLQVLDALCDERDVGYPMGNMFAPSGATPRPAWVENVTSRNVMQSPHVL